MTTLIPKTYKTIVELATENNLIQQFNKETGGLINYLNDYSDRPIVYLFLCDMIDSNLIAPCKWSCSKTETNWNNVPITIQS